MLENGSIYAVIGLPPGIFFSTSIPTCIVVLKKWRKERDVLFIDASKEFKKEGPRNYLLPEHIDKIFEAYKERKDIEKFSHVANFQEIQENEFNLNIPRYVDTSEEEEEIDLAEVFAELNKIEMEEKQSIEGLNKYFQELGLSFKL